jgi:hypothetical protein
MTLPDPIDLFDDVMAETSRLLDQLCAKLKVQGAGARVVSGSPDVTRTDQGSPFIRAAYL